jgi:putative spermidine/putrescine transport system ATP-binding protein
MAPMRASANTLALDALTKDYGAGRPAVDRLTLSVEPGMLLGLLGPSGCGKTTTLRMIAGLIPPTSGRVLVGGRDVTTLPTYERQMGVVFQSYALFPHMTVAANVGYGLKVRGAPAAEAASRITDALRLVHLEQFAERRPKQLSGGQQQRVALARALVIAPDLLLLDEPLSNLDAKLRDEMRGEIRDIQSRLGITTVFVTHDQAEAMALSDRIAVLDAGTLAQVGSATEIFDRPANAFVARFIGRVNELSARVETANAGPILRLPDGRQLPIAAAIPKGASNVTAMIRPHLIEVSKPGAAPGAFLAGVVRRRTFIGDLVELSIESDALTLIAEARPGRDEAATIEVGTPVELRWQPERTLVFAA